MNEKQNGILYHSNGCGEDANPLGLFKSNNREDECWNTPELERSAIKHDCSNGIEHEFKDSSLSGGVLLQLFENDRNLYAFKDVMECELPELIVCYKESMDRVVKDICIDEGTPYDDKNLIESKDDNKNLCNTLTSDERNHIDPAKTGADDELIIHDELQWPSEKECNKRCAEDFGIKEKVLSDFFNPNVFKSSSEDDIDNDPAKKCCREDLIVGEEAHSNVTDRIVGNALTEEFVPDNVLSVLQLGTGSPNESSTGESNEAELDVHQMSCKEKTMSSLHVSTNEESDEKDVADDSLLSSKAESGNIGFGFGSSISVASTQDGSHEPVCEQPIKSRELEPNSDRIADSPAANLAERGGGETSFSVAGPLSSRITYSGPIPYSGSISLRSDSSTTSTRSFAFPVLQPEWNSSPVRMGKADRRNFRKHKGWRQGLLCCRF